MTKFLTQVNNLVWGMPLILLLLGTGIYFTTHLKFIQFVRLKKAFSLIFKKNENQEGDVSSFQALCTALSSTIGTGNIVGVATAISAENMKVISFRRWKRLCQGTQNSAR